MKRNDEHDPIDFWHWTYWHFPEPRVLGGILERVAYWFRSLRGINVSFRGHFIFKRGIEWHREQKRRRLGWREYTPAEQVQSSLQRGPIC